jgi:hypothetical protein
MVKLKFVQGILMIEKTPIRMKHIVSVIENFTMLDLVDGSFFSINRLYLLFSQISPNDEKNST